MSGKLPLSRFVDFAVLLFGVLLLIIFALQYPFSVTFPMGGDAAMHVVSARAFLGIFNNFHDFWIRLTSLWYPFPIAFFCLSALVPISWPLRFIWWISFEHIFVGLALGWLVWRLSKTINFSNPVYAAATAIAAWGLIPTTLLEHFEGASLPQLWSFIVLLLLLERFLAGSYWITLILMGVVLISHPMTAIITLCTLSFTVLVMFFRRKYLELSEHRFVYTLLITLATLAVVALAMLLKRQSVFSILDQGGDPKNIFDYLSSNIGPLLLLTPLGVAKIVESTVKRTSIGKVLILFFMFVSALFAFNNVLGVNVWTIRFESYFILSAIIASSLVFPELIRLALPKYFRPILAVLLFLPLIVTAYTDGKRTYDFYESTTRYARLHPDELSAIAWMDKNLPLGNTIASTIENRHTEWIAALTNHQWQPLEKAEDIAKVATKPTYIVFFRHRESVPDALIARPDVSFVYRNDSVEVYKYSPAAL